MTYGNLPWGVGLVVAPFIGLAFVIFLPFIGIAAIVWISGEAVYHFFKKVVLDNRHNWRPHWQPLTSFLHRSKDK
jgi:hypothetical protein